MINILLSLINKTCLNMTIESLANALEDLKSSIDDDCRFYQGDELLVLIQTQNRALRAPGDLYGLYSICQRTITRGVVFVLEILKLKLRFRVIIINSAYINHFFSYKFLSFVGGSFNVRF